MPLNRLISNAVDWTMLAGLYRVQRRHRLHDGSRAELEAYIARCEPLNRAQFYAAPEATVQSAHPERWRWPSPIESRFAENDSAHVELIPCAKGWSAPTVFILHALMSVSDRGYRRWAARFNERGWNACFVHLPFHYSRVPSGFANGELAITADLVRTGEGLRQATIELRQLIALLRARGGRDFGVLGSSYGGWVAALVASVEELRFAALLEPIIDVEHAIWRSPASIAMRGHLRARGVTPELVARHFHLSCPLHAPPLGDPANVLLIAGTHDRIAPRECLRAFHERYPGTALLEVPQGHFGYRMLPAAWDWLTGRGIV